jgi:hypothetical protein
MGSGVSSRVSARRARAEGTLPAQNPLQFKILQATDSRICIRELQTSKFHLFDFSFAGNFK